MTNKIIAVNRPTRPDPEKAPEPTEVKQEAEKKTEYRPKQKRLIGKPSKPSKPKLKKLPELKEAQNVAGDVFNLGDRIQVRAPWGLWAEAEIDKFYQVDAANVVAHFVPKTERSGWDWFGGCITSELLQKAP